MSESPRWHDDKVWWCKELIGHLICLTSHPIHDKFWKPSNTTIFYLDNIPKREWLGNIDINIDRSTITLVVSKGEKWADSKRSSSTTRKSRVNTTQPRTIWISKIRYNILPKTLGLSTCECVCCQITARTIP